MSQDDFLLNACTDRHDWKYCIKSAVPEGQHWSGTCYSMDVHCFGDWNSRILPLCGTRHWARRKESSTLPFPKFQGMAEGVGLAPVPPELFEPYIDPDPREVNLVQRLEFKCTTHSGLSVLLSGGEPKDALKCIFLHLCCLLALPARGELQSSTSSTPWDFAWCCIRLLKTEAWINFCLALAVWNIRHRDTGIPGTALQPGVFMIHAQSGVSTTFSTVLHSFHSHSGLALNTALNLPVA